MNGIKGMQCIKFILNCFVAFFNIFNWTENKFFVNVDDFYDI